MSGATLDNLLDVLGHGDGEHVAICHQRPGQPFTATITPTADAATRATAVSLGADVWFSVNPVQANATGRGTAAQVTRWAALYADLDAKPGGLPDLPTAQAVVDTLTDLLGTRPAALTFSGHGLQPFWALDPDDPATNLDTDTKRAAAQATLRRFGRLVTAVAERHHGQVDSVYDLARVLRAPGTTNHKNTPVPVVTALTGGAPLTIDQVLEVLDAYGIPHLPDDDQTTGEQLSDPAGWGHATGTCGYARTMIDGWAADNPPARHPWFIAQATRLAAAHRNGCLTETDHQKARHALDTRMTQLVTAGQTRPLSPGELADGHAWGRARAAAMTDEHLRRELGGHIHLIEPKAPVPITAAAGMKTGMKSGEQPMVDGNLATVHHLPMPAIPDLDTLERSEDGHAQALIATYGDVVRYCADRGRWLIWNGTVWDWQPEDGGAVREYAKTVARGLPEDDSGAVTHKRKALSSAGTSGALRQARTDPRIAVAINDLDAHPWELNTPSGTVDLRTGHLHPADPTHLHTQVTTFAPDPDADPVRWQSFLADTFGDNPQLIGYLQRLVGYSAVGEVGPHVLPFCIGSGGNGKGVFLEAVTAVLGDYATTAPAGFLMATTSTKHETELARLAGKRMVLCSEVNETDRFDEAKVKQLTGGDTITARFMRADHFTFTPTHQLWLMGNHRPEVRAGGDSFWRRLRQIDFKHTVPEDERVDGLQRILATDHGPAVLAWIVTGAAAYHQGGLQEPDSVKVATAEYAHDQDTVSRFLEERCHLGGGNHVQLKAAVLRGAYESWCAETGDTPVSARAFGISLRRAGIEAGRTTTSRYYTGIALLDGDEEEASSNGREASSTDLNGILP